MGRKDENIGIIGCLIIILFLPIVLIYDLIKIIIMLSKKRSLNNITDMQSDEDMDDLEFDEMNDVWDEMDREDQE